MFIRNAKLESATLAENGITRRQRGDTMIEVLVTMIIIAVGVLGAAALQVTTLQNLSSSHSASLAAISADDFSERMRANPTAALTGAYAHKIEPTSHDDCVANTCTPAQLATYDQWVWWEEMKAVLPEPKGDVRLKNGTTSTYRVTVHWDEDRSGSTDKKCPPKSEADLECYRFFVTI